MRKYLVLILAAATLLLGGGIASASTPVPSHTTNGTVTHQAAAIEANHSCSAPSGTVGKWGSWGGVTHEFVYTLYPNNIASKALWCINANGSRTVAQNNGDITVWNREGSGGTMVWHSGGGNRGATQLKFQADGNIVIRKGLTVLWAATWSAPIISRFNQCFNPTYILRTYTNRMQWTGYGTGFVCIVNGDSDGVSADFPS